MIKKIINLIILVLVFSCSSTPDDPLITPPGFDDIPKEEDFAQENQSKNQENIVEDQELEQLKKLLLKN